MIRRTDSCPHCGCELTKPRSGSDHRRFFAMISQAASNWPETADFTPRNAEHLRAYLLVSAGHHDVTFIPTQEIATDESSMRLVRLAVEATVAAFASRGSYSFVRILAGGVEILSPKSISFQTIGQKEFGPIREAVEEIILTTLGLETIDQLLRAEAA